QPTGELNLGNATARFFDLLFRGGRDFFDRYRQLLGDLAVGKHFDAVKSPLDKTRVTERLLVDFVTVGKLDLKIDEVDDRVLGFELGVVEALLGETTRQRHLTALEAGSNRRSGTGLLALVSFTAGF